MGIGGGGGSSNFKPINDNGDRMNEFPARRFSDEMLGSMKQKLDDHIERFERFEKEIIIWRNEHMEWANAEKAALTTRMSMIEAIWRSIERPVKWVGWAVTIFLAVLITSMATMLKDWTAHHFKP